MNIRKAEMKDIKGIVRLIDQAKAYFKENGIDQWQDGYPNEDVIRNDISLGHSYVLIDQDQIIGTFYYAIQEESSYQDIRNGSWHTSSPYAVVHRIVVDNTIKGHGCAKAMMDYACHQTLQQGLSSIRIDTHKDNLSMQRFLQKNGFQYCGNITLQSGAPRIAFDKIL